MRVGLEQEQMLELPMCRREEEQEDAGMESSLVGEGDMVQGVGEVVHSHCHHWTLPVTSF